MRKPQGLTKPQIAAYFRAACAAARALGEPLDAYRKRVMKEVCNATSIKQLNRTNDFDAKDAHCYHCTQSSLKVLATAIR